MKVTTVFLLFSFLFLNISIAQNPFIQKIYTADPTARVFQNKLYVYSSHDINTCTEKQATNGFCMPDYHTFSTDDNLFNWTDHGVSIDQNQVPWVAKNSYSMWAPDCIEKNGEYYLYFPAKPKDKSAFRRIGVAKSKTPIGPFIPLKKYIPEIRGIDPNIFIDDDKKSYLYYGGGKSSDALKGIALEEDMISTKGKESKIILAEGYKEASFVLKHKEKYYFTYARVAPNEGYRIEYATGNNPLGPFKYQGVIMNNIKRGTNHHSIVKYKNQWYLFYHHWSLSGNNRLRSIRADRLYFNDDGTIKTVIPTLRGIGQPQLGDTIQIDRYTEIQEAKVHLIETDQQHKGFQIDFIKDGGFVKYDNINFGDTATNVITRVASGSKGGIFEIRLDAIDGLIIATIDIPNTGSWKSWKEISSKLTNSVSGKHDIYCLFKGDSKFLYNIDWLIFDK